MLQDLFLHSDADRPHLRVGIMLDSTTMARWLSVVLSQIQESNFADVSFLIFNGLEQQHQQPSPRASLPIRVAKLLADKQRRGLLLYDLYNRFDERFAGRPADIDPSAPVDCSRALAGIPSITAAPIVKGFTHRFRKADIAAIREQNLDVILRWGFNIIRGEILKTARYGVWSYHHGDNDFYRGGPPSFWEIVEDSPTTGVLLQSLTAELDGGLVLDKGSVWTDPSLSLARNRFEQYWHGATMVIEKLWELHQHGWERLESKAVPNNFRGKKKLYRRPTNTQMAGFLLRRGSNKAAAKLGRVARGLDRDVTAHWSIRLRRGRPLDPTAPDVSGFQPIQAPRGHFWADPFLLEGDDGAVHLLFEDYDYASGRGTVAAADVDPSGAITNPRTILDTGAHLSYPFVFQDDGETFLIPESGDSQTVELYRALDAPDRWEKVCNLAEGFSAYDVTIWREDGLYWFFMPVTGHHGARFELFLFYAETLTGPRRLHPANPISRDIRCARSAGRIFLHDGKRIRPVQDGTRNYGRALGFEEIVELTPDRYQARPLSLVEPNDFDDAPRRMIGVHTYNRLGDLEVIDVCTLERRRDV